jgi:hypothetical protein
MFRNEQDIQMVLDEEPGMSVSSATSFSPLISEGLGDQLPLMEITRLHHAGSLLNETNKPVGHPLNFVGWVNGCTEDGTLVNQINGMKEIRRLPNGGFVDAEWYSNNFVSYRNGRGGIQALNIKKWMNVGLCVDAECVPMLERA